MKIRTWIVAAAVALALPAAAHAQNPDAGSWTVDLQGGSIMYSEAGAMEPAPSLGLEALYYISPNLAIGPSVTMGQGQTSPEFFVAVLNMGPDSTRVYQVGQSLSSIHYGGVVRFELMPGAAFSPYVTGGGGGYALYGDAQSNTSPTRLTGVMAEAGGGIRLTLTDRAGIQVDARDLIYFGHDRDLLNPIREDHRNCGADGTCQFPGAEADVPEASETLHNLRLSLGFRYVP